MKNIFLELTDQNDVKFSLNIFNIIIIEPDSKGSVIEANRGDSIIRRKVKESYSEVKSILASMS